MWVLPVDTMAWRNEGRLAIVVHGPRSPTNLEWARYLKDFRQIKGLSIENWIRKNRTLSMWVTAPCSAAGQAERGEQPLMPAV